MIFVGFRRPYLQIPSILPLMPAAPSQVQSLSSSTDSALDAALKSQEVIVSTLSDLLAKAEAKMDKKATIIFDSATSVATGPPGLPGPQGPAGRKGPAGQPGAQGSEGAEGARGESGEVGHPGPRGYRGPVGEKGVKGSTGIVGQPGPKGFQGVQGVRGENGEMGVAGPEGAPGPRGNDGAVGGEGKSGKQGSTGGLPKIARVVAKTAATVATKLNAVKNAAGSSKVTHQAASDPMRVVSPPFAARDKKAARSTQLFSEPSPRAAAAVTAVEMARRVAREEAGLKRVAQELEEAAAEKEENADEERRAVDQALSPVLEPVVRVVEKDVPVEVVQRPVIREQRVVQRPVIQVEESDGARERDEAVERGLEEEQRRSRVDEMLLRKALKRVREQHGELARRAKLEKDAAAVSAAASEAPTATHRVPAMSAAVPRRGAAPALASGGSSARSMEQTVARLRRTLDSLLHVAPPAAATRTPKRQVVGAGRRGDAGIVEGAEREDAAARAALSGLAVGEGEGAQEMTLSRQAVHLAKEVEAQGANGALGRFEKGEEGIVEGLKERLGAMKGRRAAALRAHLAQIERRA